MRIYDLQTGTPKEFRDLRQRNKPKNFADLGFADFQTKFACLPLICIQVPVAYNYEDFFSLNRYMSFKFLRNLHVSASTADAEQKLIQTARFFNKYFRICNISFNLLLRDSNISTPLLY